jgi:DNA-binding IscR family transcriptional regulator
VLQTLAAAHLIVEISGAEPAYTAGRPLEAITAHHVLMAMRATPGQELQTREEPVREEVYGEFARIQEAEKQVASTISLLALVQRAEARLETSPPVLADNEMKISPAIVPHNAPGETAPGHAEPGSSRSKED